ncbi:hypothetical protein PCANC_11063 [Puccinia coronata f. sp. avenae]|uniref:Ubiquitin carboxyl-terminal hydrolase 7 ICP0-binding domain-containing protein n=1 Tax=Puccinia coronata f. sp. avenae TaxID=200324 RepID=A0A2N5UVT7_9BASI|nr:hypothetical protein PCANC_11063 [Puccinia coronata f. sp. avenae]
MPPSDLPTFRVAKQQPFLDFKSKLAQDLGYQPNQIRLWVLVNRQNKTVRPDTVVPEHDPTLTMEVVRDKFVHNTNRKGSLLTCAIRPAEVFRPGVVAHVYRRVQCPFPAMDDKPTLKANGYIICLAALTPSELRATSKHTTGGLDHDGQEDPMTHSAVGEPWVGRRLAKVGLSATCSGSRLQPASCSGSRLQLLGKQVGAGQLLGEQGTGCNLLAKQLAGCNLLPEQDAGCHLLAEQVFAACNLFGEQVAGYLLAEQVAGYLLAEQVAGYLLAEQAAGYLLAEQVAGYLLAEQVAACNLLGEQVTGYNLLPAQRAGNGLQPAPCSASRLQKATCALLGEQAAEKKSQWIQLCKSAQKYGGN